MMDRPFDLSGEGRAWVEVGLDALVHNASQLCLALPHGCELMAVVKADAYGHGAERVAARLRDAGYKTFAVATVGEGVRLRESGLDGEILVMSYTHPKNTALLRDFRLTQLVVDAAHAQALNNMGYKIRVHISLDTGMRREGFDINKPHEIEEVFSYGNLAIEGIETHLSSSDSLDEDDIKFTDYQIKRFNSTIGYLRDRGYSVGKLHVQASYGLLN